MSTNAPCTRSPRAIVPLNADLRRRLAAMPFALGGAPLGNLFRAVTDADAIAVDRPCVRAGRALLRHRAALRARTLGAPFRHRVARHAPRVVRAVDQGRARAATRTPPSPRSSTATWTACRIVQAFDYTRRRASCARWTTASSASAPISWTSCTCTTSTAPRTARGFARALPRAPRQRRAGARRTQGRRTHRRLGHRRQRRGHQPRDAAPRRPRRHPAGGTLHAGGPDGVARAAARVPAARRRRRARRSVQFRHPRHGRAAGRRHARRTSTTRPPRRRSWRAWPPSSASPPHSACRCARPPCSFRAPSRRSPSCWPAHARAAELDDNLAMLAHPIPLEFWTRAAPARACCPPTAPVPGARRMNGHVDAHHHVWSLARGDYGWLTPALAPIHRDFSLADLAPLRERAGVDATVLVQAAPTVAETQFLLDVAGRSEGVVRGVVGWVDCAAADAIPTLTRLARNPLLKAVRPMLQDLPDPAWILRAGRRAHAGRVAATRPALRGAGEAGAAAGAAADVRAPSGPAGGRRSRREAGHRRRRVGAVGEPDARRCRQSARALQALGAGHARPAPGGRSTSSGATSITSSTASARSGSCGAATGRW